MACAPASAFRLLSLSRVSPKALLDEEDDDDDEGEKGGIFPARTDAAARATPARSNAAGLFSIPAAVLALLLLLVARLPPSPSSLDPSAAAAAALEALLAASALAAAVLPVVPAAKSCSKFFTTLAAREGWVMTSSWLKPGPARAASHS